MADFTDKPGFAFEPGPPPEAMRFLEGRSKRASFSFQDVEPQEHAVAFTAAKAMQLDVLTALDEELKKAMAEGLPFDTFRRNVTPRLQSLGWWGRQDMVDPVTGKVVKARLGSPRRLRTIYRSNMRAARAAGQWDRIERTKRVLPYLVYLLGASRKHRVEHQAKEGLVYPVDHSFWDRWFPPNGWNCKCHVRQISKAEAERRGISEEPAIEMRTFRNERTGEVRQAPRGIDPAWDRNPGKLRSENAAQYLAGKLDAAPEALARAAAHDAATSWRAQRIHDGSAKGFTPVAMVSEETAQAIGARTRVVQYSSETAAKERERHGEAIPALLAETQAAFEKGAVFQDGKSQVAFHNVGDEVWRYVIKPAAGGSEIFVTSFHRSNPGQRAKWVRAGGRPGRDGS